VPESSFVRYVGDPDFHDGSILDIERKNQSLIVRVRGFSGKVFLVEFGKVAGMKADRPEGMLLYALSEMNCQPPLRRFVFANWNEEDDSVLEVDAETIDVRPE
jgi:hypothetical protein